MKKFFARIVVFAMSLNLLCCGFVKKENIDTVLCAKGLELIQRMDRMAECQEYVSLISTSKELGEIISKIGEGNYSKPKAVYKVTVPTDPTGALVKLDIDDKMAKLPQELKKEIERRWIMGIATQFNSLEGAVSLAATSMITTEDNFINEDLRNSTLYFYLYEGKYAAIVSLVPENENIVSASSSFVINDSLNQITSDIELAKWIEKHGFLGNCKIEKVELEK